jgi:hypothetical protein
MEDWVRLTNGWRADDGTEYDGPAEIVVDAPLARLPWFEIVSEPSDGLEPSPLGPLPGGGQSV